MAVVGRVFSPTLWRQGLQGSWRGNDRVMMLCGAVGSIHMHKQTGEHQLNGKPLLHFEHTHLQICNVQPGKTAN